MPKPKIPSLQHLARNWHGDPQLIRKALVEISTNAPPFNYAILHKLIRQQIVFRESHDTLVECISRYERRPEYCKDFKEAFKLVHGHFDRVQPDFASEVVPRFYPISRTLMVPFRPPLAYSLSGKVTFPWISFWKSRPLAGERLSLFVTVVEELLLQDPYLEGARFEIVDVSAPAKGEPRALTVIDAVEIPRLSARRKAEMLEVFAQGFALAAADVALIDTLEERDGPDVNPDQMPLL